MAELDLLPPTDPFSFVNGAAGTGKTFLSRAWAEADPTSTMVATTGIAAINLGGTTVNSLLGYFDAASLRDKYVSGQLHHRLRMLKAAGTRWYLLDEVSMLSADALTWLVRAIRDVNASDEQYPIRLTVIGDFAQLQPVNEPFAFESPEWPAFARHTIKLTEIKRQADRDFIEALQAVRRGDAERALEFFGLRFSPTINTQFNGTTVKGKNEEVNRFNTVRLDELTGQPVTFTKIEQGQLRGEWDKIPYVLSLKIGALVMILSNKRLPMGAHGFEFVNGEMGRLVDADATTATVLLERGHAVTVPMITRENLKAVDSDRRKELILDGRLDDLKGKYEVVGRVSYMPLRIAYATTCHKVQGLSLDSVQVDIRNHFWHTPGMLYVGLSRARTAAGLRLVGNIHVFRQRCTVHPDVVRWL